MNPFTKKYKPVDKKPVGETVYNYDPAEMYEKHMNELLNERYIKTVVINNGIPETRYEKYIKI